MKSISLAILLTFFLLNLECDAVEVVDSGWQVIDIGPGVKPSFDFGPGDEIHIMGMTESPVDGIAWHAKAATGAGPWTPVTVSEGYFYGPGDLCVDETGKAHIAFHDHINMGPQHVAISPDGSVKSFLLSSSSHDGWDNSLVMGPDNILHMACLDPSAFSVTGNSLQHATFDGSTWTFQDTISGSGLAMYGLNTSVALDATGRPHVLYCQAPGWHDDGMLILATHGSPAWSFENISGGVGVGRFPTLAIGADGRFHATWLDVDPDDPTTGTVQYGTRPSGAGASWTISPVADLDDVYLEFDGARKSASIALDSSGLPHIAYADQDSIHYAVRDGASWQHTTVLTDPAAPYRSMVVLRLDSQDQPGIVFWQAPGLVRYTWPSAPSLEKIDLGLSISGSTISYRTASAGTYQLESSTDLKTWKPEGDPVLTDGTPNDIDMAIAAGIKRYYRVVFQAP